MAANPVDAVFTLGDLQPDWIASLATLDLRGLPGSERRKSCGSGASSRWISGSSAPTRGTLDLPHRSLMSLLSTGFTSTIGVPSTASRLRTRTLPPSIEAIST